jgi:hypothetical protein
MSETTGGETEQDRPFTFEDISWTGSTILRDENLLRRNINAMKMLLEAGAEPTEVIDNDYASNIPKTYEIGDVEIGFLPHWGFYEAGGLSLGVPEDQETLLTDIEAARYIASRQPED